MFCPPPPPTRLSAVLRRLLSMGSVPACWRQANVTPNPKGPLYSSAANYRPISITPALSQVFEHGIGSVRRVY